MSTLNLTLCDEDLISKEHGRKTTENNHKIDHKFQAVGYGNILFLDVDTVDNEMGGVPWRIDDGHHSGPIIKSDQAKSPISISDSGVTATAHLTMDVPPTQGGHHLQRQS